MNVDGAFILAEICRNQEDLMFVDHSMQIFIRYISLRIWEDVCHTHLLITSYIMNGHNHYFHCFNEITCIQLFKNVF